MAYIGTRSPFDIALKLRLDNKELASFVQSMLAMYVCHFLKLPTVHEQELF